MAQCFSADPGVLSKYDMDAPGLPACALQCWETIC